MSTISYEAVVCASCDKSISIMVLGSTASFGSPDLDLRPALPAREALYQDIQRCIGCGYCSYDISVCSDETKDIVRSAQYQNILKNKHFPDVALSYIALSYENELKQEFIDAAWNTIGAAWICDDSQQIEEAKGCRLKAIKLIEKINLEVQSEEYLDLVKIDLMRRVEMFMEALSAIQALDIESLDEIQKKVIEFERKLIREKDSRVYKIADAAEFE